MAKKKQSSKPSQPKADLGICNACQQPLKQLPFNTRMDMVCCGNPHCKLYRERMRLVTLALPRNARLLIPKPETPIPEKKIVTTGKTIDLEAGEPASENNDLELEEVPEEGDAE